MWKGQLDRPAFRRYERHIVTKKNKQTTKGETTQAVFLGALEDEMMDDRFRRIIEAQDERDAAGEGAVDEASSAAFEAPVEPERFNAAGTWEPEIDQSLLGTTQAAAIFREEALSQEDLLELETQLAPTLNPREFGDALSKEFYRDRKEELRGRVSERRFNHVMGVAKTAKQLAEIYGVDPRKAKLAGLLHDWDKGYKDDAIRARAIELEVDVPDIVLEDMPQTLHGMTAAVALGREYPCIPDDVLQAVYRHTSGAVGMSPLDMVVYIADCIEPGRTMEIVDEVRELVGKVELEELFFRTHGVWMTLVIGRKTTFHPDTLDVWNYYAARHRARRAAERAAAGKPAFDADPDKVAGAKS